MRWVRAVLVAGLATVGLPFGALAAPSAGEVNAYLRAEMELRGIPGLGWAVVEVGRIALRGSLGFANVELGAAVDERTVFPIASLDKQLTAAGVLELVEAGQLALDADAAKLLGLDLPGLQVHHLLSHLSGLPDEVAPPVLGRQLTSYTGDELLAHVRSLVPIAPPGVRYRYSDANFLLAQTLTERVSDESWRDFMRRRIFAPAGIDGVAFLDPGAIVPGRAAAYGLGADGGLQRDGRIEVDYGPLYNDLGMTVSDFARWLVALGGDAPLTRATRERMWTPARLAGGRLAHEAWQWPRYGLGVGLDRLAGERAVLHSGSSGVGFLYLPDRRFGVVVFTNLRHSSGSDPVGLALGIGARFHPQLDFAARPPAPDADPRHVERARALYESLLAGEPALALVAAGEQTAVADGAAALAGRSRRWGALREFHPLGVDGDGSSGFDVFLALHERARVVLRLGFDRAGLVETLAWAHP